MSRLSAIATAVATLLLLPAGAALAQGKFVPGARPSAGAEQAAATADPVRYEPDKLRSALMAIVPPRLMLGGVAVLYFSVLALLGLRPRHFARHG